MRRSALFSWRDREGARRQATVKNNGTQTWPAGGSNPVHLGIHFAPQGGGYATSGSSWVTDQRFSLPSDLAPGQSATLTVTVNAPAASGNDVLAYQMVQENIAWFPQYVDSQAAVGTGNPAYASGTTYVTTTPGGQVISERVPNGSGGYTAYYYLYDGLGSVVALTNSTGAIVNSYAYDPYGNATSVSEQVANPFRYIGAIWDASTGLYKMGERYYDPTIGRFTQLDPSGGGYTYAGDNPINQVDPTGLFSLSAFIKGVRQTVKNDWFRIDKNAFRWKGEVEERWHFHLDPFRNSNELMKKYHLPYQWKGWWKNFQAIARRRLQRSGMGKFVRWLDSVARKLQDSTRDLPPPEDLDV